MRGTGAVTIGRDMVYAYFTVAGQSARLRLSVDECDRLDLFRGRQVLMGFSDQKPSSVLVTSVVHAPPFVWVEVEFTTAVSRAG